MNDDMMNDILDDMDFASNGMVAYHVIERMLPQLNKMVEKESMY